MKTPKKGLSPEEKPIVHSDRGVHYRWPGWIERMDKSGLTRRTIIFSI